jgi:hypothetical protein
MDRLLWGAHVSPASAMLRAELADIEAHTVSLITDGRSVNDIVDESSSVLRNSSNKRF